ncbi:MAG: HoxN/HupN/NixA family nickel/cobalt transporter [Vulcanimicrobiaceae bacterium]
MASESVFGIPALRRVLASGAAGVRRKVLGLYLFLGAATVVVWALAWLAFASRPVLLGTCLLAYTFGLRHAVDADHIAAIDNATRKLMQQGKRPVAVGFFFSLGHSTVVVALTLAIAVAAATIQARTPDLERVGGIVGTLISAGFLFLIALVNIVVFLEIARAFRAVRRGQAAADRSLDDLLDRRGFFARIFRPLFRLIGSSWHLYPIGFLFGLGFDTATEIGLLGIAAIEAGRGLPVYDILLFPLLFTLGMSLLDTTDGILMLGAYGWAFVKPLRKLYYNMTITLVSILVALLVGAIELFGILASETNAHGPFWAAISRVNANFGTLGFAIVGIFVASWLISTLIYRLRRYDELEKAAPPAEAIAS